MFVEYLSDSAWENRSHRGWTALASFTLQALALSVLLVLPILYSSFVPSLEFIRPLVAPQAQPAPVPESAHAARSTPRTSSLTVEGRPIAPQSIPRTIPRIVDETPPVDLSHIGVPGSTGGPGSNNAVMNALAGSGIGHPPPLLARPVVHPPRISRSMEAYLVNRVEPLYPQIAKSAGIRGQVILRAVISKDGIIEICG